ncbi:MAG: redoxin family protein [Planctomycetota bacterium]|nr:redoxin family protein [Planctomycetota bacterium]
MKKTALIALALLLSALSAPALDLGDPAPEISVDSWVTGEPADPTKTNSKTIYLVEVWSTTCPPCVRTIPLLGELQKRYAEQGLKIISFTDDTREEVEPFLKDHPMEYSSFIDKDGDTMVNYMAADNRNTIPHAFLFDRSGALVWTGNPLDNLEKRVRQVLDGSLNLEKALAQRNAWEDLEDAYRAQDTQGMIDSLTKLERLDPDNYQYYQLHYRLISELGAGGSSDSRELFRLWRDGCRDNPNGLITLAVTALGQGDPALRDPELALEACRRAYELGGETKLDAGLNLAEIYKEAGRPDLSAALARELAKEAAPDQAEDIGNIGKYYDRLMEMGKKLGAANPK